MHLDRNSEFLNKTVQCLVLSLHVPFRRNANTKKHRHAGLHTHGAKETCGDIMQVDTVKKKKKGMLAHPLRFDKETMSFLHIWVAYITVRNYVIPHY